MSKQSFATKAYAVIGRAKQQLRAQFPALDEAALDRMIQAAATKSSDNALATSFSGACTLLKKPA